MGTCWSCFRCCLIPLNQIWELSGGAIGGKFTIPLKGTRWCETDLSPAFPNKPDLSFANHLLARQWQWKFGTEINSTISTTEQAGAASAQPPAGTAIVADTNLDGALDLVFGSGAVALGDGKGDFSSGTPVVQVSIPSVPAAFSYFNIASPGTIQPAGSTYPDLVFAPSGGSSAPFPLVAIPNSSPFAVQSGSASPTVTVSSGQSASVPLSVTGAASYTDSVTLTCTGLPAGASCTFNPGTLTLAGGAAQSSMLTISTAAGNMAQA
jgi:hypothetical protein